MENVGQGPRLWGIPPGPRTPTHPGTQPSARESSLRGPAGPSGQGGGSARGQRRWDSGRSWTRSCPELPASLPGAAGRGAAWRAGACPGRERRGPRAAGNLDAARAAGDVGGTGGGAWARRGGTHGHVTGRGYKAARSRLLRELVLPCDPAPGPRREEPRLRLPAPHCAPPRLRVSAAVLRPSPPAQHHEPGRARRAVQLRVR